MSERKTADPQVEFWRRYDPMEARLTRPVSERMVELAGIGPGMRVLDVAPGRGEPALEVARRVGPSGSVLATDVSDGVLQIARERAAEEGLANIEFRVADAESLDAGEGRFDAATLRWALMYMPEPERALRAIHRALKPSGVFVVASWAEPERVPFAWLARRVLARYREPPPLVVDGPGVFRHADRASFEALLERHRFSVEASEEIDIPVVEGHDGREILSWIRALGGPVVEAADQLPPEQTRAWEEEIVAELEKSGSGKRVTLGGVTRLTVARNRP